MFGIDDALIGAGIGALGGLLGGGGSSGGVQEVRPYLPANYQQGYDTLLSGAMNAYNTPYQAPDYRRYNTPSMPDVLGSNFLTPQFGGGQSPMFGMYSSPSGLLGSSLPQQSSPFNFSGLLGGLGTQSVTGSPLFTESIFASPEMVDMQRISDQKAAAAPAAQSPAAQAPDPNKGNIDLARQYMSMLSPQEGKGNALSQQQVNAARQRMLGFDDARLADIGSMISSSGGLQKALAGPLMINDLYSKKYGESFF